MSTATFKVALVTVPPISCPKVILPTKSDLVNMFSQLANLPAQLILAGQKEAAEKIQAILDEVRGLLSIYDPNFKGLSIPEIEWEIMITRLVQDYPMYVQQKILEIISSVALINFNINILGISVNLLKIFTAEEIGNIKAQIAEDVDKFFDLLPSSYKLFGGDYGLQSLELKAEAVWSYMRSLMNGGLLKILHEGLGSLIKIFKAIWDTLDLPSLPDLTDLNVESLITALIESWKKKKDATYAELIEMLEGFSLAGFSLIDLIGGKIEESIVSAERQIDRLLEAARDFGENWPRYLIVKWMESVTKFFEAIGLDSLVAWITFTFCDFLNLLGFPKTLDLSFSENITVGSSSAAVLPT